MSRIAAIIAAAVVGAAAAQPLVVPAASASQSLETLGSMTDANALTARILGRGPGVTYFNPGLLPLVDEQFTVGIFFISQQFNTGLNSRPTGADSVDISDDIYRAWVRDSDGKPIPLQERPLPTAELKKRGSAGNDGSIASFVQIGLVKRIVDTHLVLGIYANLPIGTFQKQTSRFADHREQFFSNSLEPELYGDRMAQMSVSFGLGGKVGDYFSWGAGLRMAIATTTINPVYMPDGAQQDVILITTDTSVDTAFSPHFSVVATPTEAVTITATIHAESKSSTTGKNIIKLWNANGTEEVIQNFQFVNGFLPLTVSWGASGSLGEAGNRWVIGAQMWWMKWSDFIDRSGDSPTALGTAWDDTLNASLGARYEVDRSVISMDIAWVTTPVPDQVGMTSYVDNHRLGFALSFDTQFELAGVPLQAAVQFQVHHLLSRSVTKDAGAASPVVDEFPDDAFDPVTGDAIASAQGLQTNNPGFPGFSSSGWLVGGGLTLKAPF